MDFLDLAKKRFSVRKFIDKPIEEDKILKILEAGRIAPTAVNYQPQRILVVKDPRNLAKLEEARRIFGATLALVVCANHDESWKRSFDNKDFADVDASIITDHMMLQATELGLGSVWISSFDPALLIDLFNIPNNFEAINILAIGYPVESIPLAASSPDRHNVARKPLSETVFYETF
ncbi:MAG: nitroreductase [Clostridiales bacterium]|jgi:nitroreductase|nr:nitroreductase [Clostridiales bacterium]